MGILRATGDAIKGGFGDAWLETIEPDNMGEHTGRLMTLISLA